jgi:hypothetical protein
LAESQIYSLTGSAGQVVTATMLRNDLRRLTG